MPAARLEFADESYSLASVPESSKRIINLFPEITPPGARSKIILRSVPGLVRDRIIGTGPIIAANDSLSVDVYLISGTHFWRIRPNEVSVPEDLGDVGTAAISNPKVQALASIAVGVVAAVVCVPPNAWVCAHDGPLQQITDPAFPGASSVAYIDGYFVFTGYGSTAQFFWSSLLDAKTYSALDFAYADSRPNIIRRVIQHRGDLWFMGESGLEAWYDAGGKDIPFLRRPGSDISYGCGSPQTVSICDNSIFFLSNRGIVFRIDGYRATRVSTHAVEEWIRDYGNTLTVDACSYTQAGHWYYCLTFTGTFPRTLVYDSATGRWHERDSGDGFWVGRSSFTRAEALFIGSRTTGELFRLDPYTPTDAGRARMFQATLPPVWAETVRAFMSSLELEMEPGLLPTGADVQCEVSDDGGKTYRTISGSITSGTAGDFKHRVRWTRLGSFRQRVIRFTLGGVCALYGADADMEQGRS